MIVHIEDLDVSPEGVQDTAVPLPPLFTAILDSQLLANR
jgi:hypothetical protein